MRTMDAPRAVVIIVIGLGLGSSLPAAVTHGETDDGGRFKKWHKVTLDFEGPATSEIATPNPFTDFRLNVAFSHAESGVTYLIPGYYAADGNAAETSSDSGSTWRAHFSPDALGTWTYQASFRAGPGVATDDRPTAGKATAFDGDSGSIEVVASDKAGRDFRATGRLEYVGKHHLQFAETGTYFLKCGADAPENFLSYADFDGDFKSDGVADNRVKDWSAHVRDWRPGDPTWQGSKGKGIIGAINYLASEGLNAFSFLTLNIEGDDKNVFPYLTYHERERMDCSRLDQWETVMTHADRLGMYLHFKTQETENEMLLDDGDTGPLRKLYYRELIARFGHHLALNWNLGEECGALGDINQNTSQRKAMAQYFWDHDPYRHLIVIHNGMRPDDLLGDASRLTGYSLQTSKPDFRQVHGETKRYIDRSAAAGRPWVVACDEPGDAQHSLRPDNDAGSSHDDARKNALWGNILAGGAGLEWYFGYAHDHSDLTCEDWRSRDRFWDQCRYALQFFAHHDIPFWAMRNDNEKSSARNDYAFFQDDVVYLVYLKEGGTTKLDLTEARGTFDVQWFDPRNGGDLQSGSVATVKGGGARSLGTPPQEPKADWVALVKKKT